MSLGVTVGVSRCHRRCHRKCQVSREVSWVVSQEVSRVASWAAPYFSCKFHIFVLDVPHISLCLLVFVVETSLVSEQLFC